MKFSRFRYFFYGFLFSISVMFGLACAFLVPRQLAQIIPIAIAGEATAAPTVMTVPTEVLPLAATPVPPPPTATAIPVVPPTPTQAAQIIEPLPTPAQPLPTPDSAIIEFRYTNTIPADVINELQEKFYPTDNQVPAKYDVDRYQLRFRSRNEGGHLVPIRAEIYIPKVNTPAEFPVFVYGAGTTGIGNLCAPLDELTRGRNWGLYQTHLLSYATHGYIAMLPHWQGYDDQTRTHPYFIAELEGSIMLDATRVVYEIFNKMPPAENLAQPAQSVFYGGYSQGGHGAFAAVDMAGEYAPELPIKGIIGHATAPDVEALLRERPPLGPYIVYAYLNYYGGEVIEPADVFLPHWLETFYQDASTKCVDEAYEYYPKDPKELYKPEFLNALYSGQLGDYFPEFKRALDDNYVGNSVEATVPVILLHGEADTIVTSDTNEQFVAHLCNAGKNVSYNLYKDVNHFKTRQHSFVDTLSWMEAVLNGNNPESDCASFFNSKFE